MKKDGIKDKPITKSDIAYIVHHYPDSSARVLGLEMGRTSNSVTYLIQQIKLAGYSFPKKKLVNLKATVEETLKELGINYKERN